MKNDLLPITRKVCTHCKRKRSEKYLVQIRDKITGKTSWICASHTSKKLDISDIKLANKKPVFVELFSGSGTVSKVARSAGFESWTVDIEEKFKPDICIDILNLRRSHLPGSVDVVWCSLPCTVYSIMSLDKHWTKVNLGYRKYYYIPKSQDALDALKILQKTISLILKMKPLYYFIENPRGALRHFPHIQFIPYRHTVSYSDYGFDIYKPTDIFTNCGLFKPTKIRTAVNRKFRSSVLDMKTAYERAIVPPALIEYLIDCISFLVKPDQATQLKESIHPGQKLQTFKTLES